MKKRKGCFYLLGAFFILCVILFSFYKYNEPLYPKGRQTVRQVSHDGRFQLDGGDPLFILQDVKYAFALDRSAFSSVEIDNRLYSYGASGFIVIDEKEDHIYCLPIYKGKAEEIISIKGYRWEEFSDNDKKVLLGLIGTGEAQRLVALRYLNYWLDYWEKKYNSEIQEGKDASDTKIRIDELKKALEDEDLFIPVISGL
jgi:hypothetical protein